MSNTKQDSFDPAEHNRVARQVAVFLASQDKPKKKRHIIELLYVIPNRFLGEVLNWVLLNPQGIVIDINQPFRCGLVDDPSTGKLDHRTELQGLNLIHYLLKYSHIITLTEVLLIKRNVDLSVQDGEGNTPLMLCTTHAGNRKLFEIFLGYLIAFKTPEERRRCINIQNKNGDTLLHLILQRSLKWFEEINRLLIEGANPNITNNNMSVPLVFSILNAVEHSCHYTNHSMADCDVMKSMQQLSKLTCYEHAYKCLPDPHIAKIVLKYQLILITFASVRLISRLSKNKWMKKVMTLDMVRLLSEFYDLKSLFYS